MQWPAPLGVDAHPEAGRLPPRELLRTAWSGIFTQSLPLCAAFADTILKLRASSGCWKHRANPAGDAVRLALVDEAAAGRISRAGANGPTCGAVCPGNGSVIQSRGCAPNTRPFIRLLGSEDHGRGLRRQIVPSGVSPRGPLRTPNAAIPILRSELTPSAPCGRVPNPLAANLPSLGLLKKPTEMVGVKVMPHRNQLQQPPTRPAQPAAPPHPK